MKCGREKDAFRCQVIRAKQKQLLRDLELLGCWSECVKFTLSIQLSFPQDAAAPQLHFVMLLA